MESSIVKFLSKYIALTEEEISVIESQSLVREYPKGTVLLRAGQYAKECYLVFQGCVRKYYLVDGEEKTTEFFTENQPITPASYIKQAPSEYYLSCTEDCILSAGNSERTQQFLIKFPRFAFLLEKITNDLLVDHQLSFDDFKNLPPEKRYSKLVTERPDLVQRVPQYHLASYLGIKPQSLSRIRKRLMDRKP